MKNTKTDRPRYIQIKKLPKGTRRVYIDTSALIAITDKRDMNHNVAHQHYTEYLRNQIVFVIGLPVLVEFIDGVVEWVGKQVAIQLLNMIINSKHFRIAHYTKKDIQKAVQYFTTYSQSDIDMTDCLSAAIMKKMKINTIFTFDKSHFQMLGFNVVP